MKNPNPKGEWQEKTKRNKQIYLQWAEYHSSYEKLGKMFGISRQRAYAIIQKEQRKEAFNNHKHKSGEIIKEAMEEVIKKVIIKKERIIK